MVTKQVACKIAFSCKDGICTPFSSVLSRTTAFIVLSTFQCPHLRQICDTRSHPSTLLRQWRYTSGDRTRPRGHWTVSRRETRLIGSWGLVPFSHLLTLVQIPQELLIKSNTCEVFAVLSCPQRLGRLQSDLPSCDSTTRKREGSVRHTPIKYNLRSLLTQEQCESIMGSPKLYVIFYRPWYGNCQHCALYLQTDASIIFEVTDTHLNFKGNLVKADPRNSQSFISMMFLDTISSSNIATVQSMARTT